MPFEVVNTQIKNRKEEMLAELQFSREKNNAIGILTKDTHELVTTAVTEIAENSEGDYVIVLRDQDLHGHPVERTRLLLSNIERIIHFNISYDDPQYVKERRKEKFKA
ncbi:MAG TPA: hypothetical protein VEB86_15925 [Chryseosolibacter sp.]|nr:hypothetical protein [Chryseosolibacter sp.]